MLMGIVKVRLFFIVMWNHVGLCIKSRKCCVPHHVLSSVPSMFDWPLYSDLVVNFSCLAMDRPMLKHVSFSAMSHAIVVYSSWGGYMEREFLISHSLLSF